MRKISIFVLIIALIIALTACGAKSETIEGYWMAEGGDTISFNSDGKAIVDGLAFDYSIYDDNKLSISFLGIAEEYKFELNTDVLVLTTLSNSSVEVFYRDETKQKEIQENLKRIQLEKAEQEKIQKQIEEKNQYIADLKTKVYNIESEISLINGWIEDNKQWILDAEQWIVDEYELIDEADKEILEIQSDPNERASEKIQQVNERKELCLENISRYKNDIVRYETDITQYEQTITELETEKEDIIKKLSDLGE